MKHIRFIRDLAIILAAQLILAGMVQPVSAGLLHYVIGSSSGASYDITIDDSVPDTDPDPLIGKYVQPPGLTPPAHLTHHDPYFYYQVKDDPAGDSITIVIGDIITILPGSPVPVPPGDYPHEIRLIFNYAASQFPSDAFTPIVFPASGGASVGTVNFDSLPPDEITSVTLLGAPPPPPPAVPEPSSLLLLAIGAAPCCAGRWLRQKTRRAF